MTWEDVHDPAGEVDFAMEWTRVSEYYTPEVLQGMIDATGVAGIVRTVNEHFQLVSGTPALYIGTVGERKTITQA